MLLHILLLFLFSSSAVVAVPAGVSSGAGHTRRIGSGSGSNAINHAPEEIFPLFGELPTRAVGMTWYRVLIEDASPALPEEWHNDAIHFREDGCIELKKLSGDHLPPHSPPYIEPWNKDRLAGYWWPYPDGKTKIPARRYVTFIQVHSDGYVDVRVDRLTGLHIGLLPP
ncbi:hypothetical protein AX14_011946 [Amanita brunnescens Koide BX004]|nr:hypothetical protein AX14_011946 [Amanita brunnescens Koide BX004]